MKNMKYFAVALLALLIGVAATSAFGQDLAKEKAKQAEDKIKEAEHKIKDAEHKLKEKAEYKSMSFCSNNDWSGGDKVSVSDLREMTIPAGGTITVDAGRNGGVGVKGEDRNDVLVRACVQTWGTSEEAAKAVAGSVRIGTSGVIKAEGPGGDEQGWSVSYQIVAPRVSNLKLNAMNGGISISNIDGAAEFETKNGGVNLNSVSGDFRGRTQNGGVNVNLTGTSWRGSGLDVATTNGGVHISMPANYAARVQTATVNGGFNSEIVGLEAPKADDHGRRQPVKIDQEINGGGATIRAVTTNGGVKITTIDGQPMM
jgi:hypothetical protein